MRKLVSIALLPALALLLSAATIIRIPFPGGGDAQPVGYTEAWSTFTTPTAATWTAKTLSVPANCVVEILMRNTAGLEMDAGVRAYGSSLDRRFPIRGRKDSGEVPLRMFVQADAYSRIEYYAETATDTVFTILSYRSDITFSELWDNVTVTSTTDTMWTAKIATNCAASSVAVVTCQGYASAPRFAGVRAYGSSLERKFDMERGCTLSMPVKLSGTMQYEIYLETYLGQQAWIQGYFSAAVDYQELMQSIDDLNGLGSWYTIALDAYLDDGGRVCDILVGGTSTAYTAGYQTLGARATTSALQRKYNQDELYAASNVMDSVFTVRAVAGDIKTVCDNSTQDNFHLVGYFK